MKEILPLYILLVPSDGGNALTKKLRVNLLLPGKIPIYNAGSLKSIAKLVYVEILTIGK